jgi:hypothetical protein
MLIYRSPDYLMHTNNNKVYKVRLMTMSGIVLGFFRAPEDAMQFCETINSRSKT